MFIKTFTFLIIIITSSQSIIGLTFFIKFDRQGLLFFRRNGEFKVTLSNILYVKLYHNKD